jgi:8-oxo-dGTP diphosphatase
VSAGPDDCLDSKKIVRAGVACLVLRWTPHDVAEQQLKVLVLQRKGSHGAGEWSVPGGWMEFGEGAAEAALREVEEETGIKAVYLKPLGVTEDFFGDEGKHCITLWHSAIAPVDAEPVFTEPDKVAGFKWILPGGPFPAPLFLPFKNFLEQGIAI